MKAIKNYIIEKLHINKDVKLFSKNDAIKEIKTLLKKNEYEDVSDNAEDTNKLMRYDLYKNAYCIEDAENSFNGCYGTTFVISGPADQKYILNFHKFSEEIMFGFMKKGTYQVYTIIKRGISGWETVKKKFIKELKLK